MLQGKYILLDLKLGLKINKKQPPQQLLTKEKYKTLENEQDFTSLFFSKLFRTDIKIKIVQLELGGKVQAWVWRAWCKFL